MFIIKFCFYFCASFLILSFPVGKETVFDHLHGFASPYTGRIFHTIKDKSAELYHGTINFSRKLFTNISPVSRDSVNENLSSIKRDEQSHAEKDQDSYTAEERDMLSSILKKAQ